jgi:micrococcal nuclease
MAKNETVYDTNMYKARMLRVIDGDTVQVNVDLGLRVHRSLYLRLAGIDTPELRGGSEKSKSKAREATEFLRHFVSEREILVRFEKGKSFDRWVGHLFLDLSTDEEERHVYVNEEMVKAGYARRVDR